MGFLDNLFGSASQDHGQRWTAEAQGHMREDELARCGGGDPGHRPPGRASLFKRLWRRLRRR